MIYAAFITGYIAGAVMALTVIAFCIGANRHARP